MKVKNILFSLLLVVGFTAQGVANAGMPGFWDVGAGINFIPFYAKDSVHLGKVQMQRELVTIMLHPGFAVVKGEYYMRNLTDQAITMNTGYPINSGFKNDAMTSVNLTDLYGLQVKVNTKFVTVKRASSGKITPYNADNLDQTDNWYIWEATYAPKAVTKITVYFIVNTNEAQLREGYNADYHNGFSYLLESGRAWGKNIEQGRIFVQLMDTLQLSSVQGVYPFKIFKTDGKKQLVYDFKDLEPTAQNNIVIRYSRQIDNFNFDKIQQSAAAYFKKIDALKGDQIKTDQWKVVQAVDFKIYAKNGGMLLYFPLLAIYVLPLLILVFAVVMFVRQRKKKRKA